MANETILIVDADTKSQKVLEVSFKKAGYRVVMTDGPARARELVQDVSPDIIISDTQFAGGGDGFEFLADVKQGSAKGAPFIFLTEERSLPQKMKGFELGADDYLTKPIYIKEVTTRVELLLQKRQKEQLSEDDIEEIEGNVSDITMIDLLQTIEEELRSGTIHLTREDQSAVIYFREGNILDAICGKLQGEEAIYRLMLWPDGEFVLRYHDQVRRVDRIEKDSGALLLEGIRRLDRYNELVDGLPNLGRVFEADYERLSQVMHELPAEVGRIVRLFDGLRSIRDVADGSPLDDVTTLKIVDKLIGDGLLVDVTPSSGGRDERRSRSNLATWLEGARTEDADDEIGREDTSPKFGSSIKEMVSRRGERPERRTKRTIDAQPRETIESANPRSPRDTDPFGSGQDVSGQDAVAARAGESMVDVLDDLDELARDERPKRRKTALQWERPRSGWNIHFDKAEESDAAIREIEEEERRRRAEEAKHITGVHREATLRFAPSVDRDSGPDVEDEGLLRQIEADERRRREEEARRLQEQMEGMQPVDGPDGATARRVTDELPSQPRVPAAIDKDEEERVDTDELHLDTGEPREREPTPLSSPAFGQLEESSAVDVGAADVVDEDEEVEGQPSVEFEVPEVEVSLAGDVSEADAFHDSDEYERVEREEEEDEEEDTDSTERTTLDIRPPADLTPLGVEGSEPEVTPDIDPSGLYDELAMEETEPSEEDLDEIEIEALEALPEVERQATDQELVTAEYDLSGRSTIAPWELTGRAGPDARERETVELDKAPSKDAQGSDHEFFDSEPSEDAYYDEFGPAQEKVPVGLIVGLLLAVLVVVGVFMFGPEPETQDPTKEIATKTEPTEPEEPVEPVEPAEPIVEEPAGPTALDEFAAITRAQDYATNIGTSSLELAMVFTGEDILARDAGMASSETDAGTEPAVAQPEEPSEPSEPIASVKEPKEPVEQPVEPKEPKEPKEASEPQAVTITRAELRRAERLVKAERLNEAVKLLQGMIKSDPKHAKAQYLLGRALLDKGRKSDAIRHLSAAERLGHRTGQTYLDLAAAYQLDGKSSRAKWAYEKFLEVQPNGKQAEEVRTILSTQF